MPDLTRKKCVPCEGGMPAMMRIVLPLLCVMGMFVVARQSHAASLADRLAGRILLQVESHGEAWYVNPQTKSRHYLGRPDDAFQLMRTQGLGISNDDLIYIPVGFQPLSGVDRDGDGLADRLEEVIGTVTTLADSDYDGFNDAEEIKNGYHPMLPFKKAPIDRQLVARVKGKVLLQVERHGEAWYVNPVDGKRYFLGRPADAFEVMKRLGLGISNHDLATIPRSDTGAVLWREYVNNEFRFSLKYPDFMKVTEKSVALGSVIVKGIFFETSSLNPQPELYSHTFAVLPQGEFDFGVPAVEPVVSQVTVADQRVEKKVYETRPANQNFATTVNRLVIIKFPLNSTDLPSNWDNGNHRLQYTEAHSEGVTGPDYLGMMLGSFRFTDSDWLTYRNQDYQYELKYPDDWMVEENNAYPYTVVLIPKQYQNSRRDLMVTISPLNPGRESVFDPGNENLASCQITSTFIGGRKARECIAQSIMGYSRYVRFIDRSNTTWQDSNEIAYSLPASHIDLLPVYNQVLSSFKFIN